MLDICTTITYKMPLAREFEFCWNYCKGNPQLLLGFLKHVYVLILLSLNKPVATCRTDCGSVLPDVVTASATYYVGVLWQNSL